MLSPGFRESLIGYHVGFEIARLFDRHHGFALPILANQRFDSPNLTDPVRSFKLFLIRERKLSENRTNPPPKPFRPLARPGKLPVIRQETAVPMFPRQEPRIRPQAASDTDLVVAADHERLNALERRLGRLEPILERVDTNTAEVRKDLADEIRARELKEITKDGEKTVQEHKTKRFMALLAALPIILAPLGVIGANKLSQLNQAAPIQTVVHVSEYQKEVTKCAETEKDPQSWQECVSMAQLRATPLMKR